MGAIEILSLVDLLLTGVEKLAPRVAELTQKGEITPAQQAALLDRISGIISGDAFSAPHWQPQPDPLPPAD